MSRVTYGTVRRGRKPRSGGLTTLDQLHYEVGEAKRIVFPIVDGSLLILAKPFHRVLNKSLEMKKRDGSGTYAIGKVRCTHPYSQLSDEDTKEVLKIGEMCTFCNIAKYEERKMWEIINSEYPDGEFSNLSKEEKKKFFQEWEKEKTVEASYYKKQTDDGETENATTFDMYILALELELAEKNTVKLVGGKPKYKPIIMPISSSRLDKFKTAVDEAINSGTITDDLLHPYVEEAGTEYEEEVLIGWVDFRVSFPNEADKMASGRKMTVTPVSAALSVVDDEFIKNFESEVESIKKQANDTIDKLFVTLKAHTREQALEMLVDGAEYYHELEENYRITESFENDKGNTVPSDDEVDAEVFAKVREYQGEDTANAESDNEAENSEEKTKPKKEKPASKEESEESADKKERKASSGEKSGERRKRPRPEGQRKRRRERPVEDTSDLDEDEEFNDDNFE